MSIILTPKNIIAMPYTTGPGYIRSSDDATRIARSGNTPISTKIRLYVHGPDKFVFETTSDSAGHWEIKNLSLMYYYYAKIEDPTFSLNGAVITWMKPIVP